MNLLILKSIYKMSWQIIFNIDIETGFGIK